jgi:hypothetical protein
MRIAHQIVTSVGTANQCYTVVDKQLNAYGKWAGCPGGSGPGYSSTMRYMPNENSSGLGPNIGGSICNCTYLDSAIYPPVNTASPVITGNTEAGSTLTTTNGTWTGTPPLTFGYQWYRGTTSISGQTTNSYVTQPADIGQSITCQVTGSNAGGSIVVTSNIITPTHTPTVLIDTNNFNEFITSVTYYLAQGNTPYVMPAGSFMTSFTVYIEGTNIVIDFQNASSTNLFTWYDNQSRIATVPTTVNLATAVNISGCSQFTCTNLLKALASYPGTGIANLGIIIYGFII